MDAVIPAPPGRMAKASPCLTSTSPFAFSASSKIFRNWSRDTGPPVAMVMVPPALGSIV